MSEVEFSIIFPTRGDSNKLTKLFNSIHDTTKYLNRIELLIAIDAGDIDTINFIKDFKPKFKHKVFEVDKTDNFSEDYYNFLARNAIGNNIWALNDDVSFITKHWDEKILSKISSSKLPFYLIDTKDSTRGNERLNKDFCCFPLISKKAVDAIGFLFYKQVRVYPSDKIIYSLYSGLSLVIDALDVELKSEYVDEIKNTRMWNIFQEDLKSGVLNVSIGKEIYLLCKALVKHINNK